MEPLSLIDGGEAPGPTADNAICARTRMHVWVESVLSMHVLSTAHCPPRPLRAKEGPCTVPPHPRISFYAIRGACAGSQGANRDTALLHVAPHFTSPRPKF